MNISYDNPPDLFPAPYDYASDVESSSSSMNSPIARHNTQVHQTYKLVEIHKIELLNLVVS